VSARAEGARPAVHELLTLLTDRQDPDTASVLDTVLEWAHEYGVGPGPGETEDEDEDEEEPQDVEEEPFGVEEAEARLSAWLGVHDPQPGAEATEVATAEYLVTVRCVNHLPYSAEEWQPEPALDQLADREALGGDSACDSLAMAVVARSATEALYKTADAVGCRLPGSRAGTSARFVCEFEVTVGCEYASDSIESGCEADSAFRALVSTAGFDQALREHRASEW